MILLAAYKQTITAASAQLMRDRGPWHFAVTRQWHS